MIDKMTQLVEDSLEEAKELAIAHRNYGHSPFMGCLGKT